MADLSSEQLTGILKKTPDGVAQDDVMRQLIASGHTFAGKKFDPQTLKPIAPLPQSSSGQNIYPQPRLAGGAPPPTGTDPLPDFVRGVKEGFSPKQAPPTPEIRQDFSIPEKIGQTIGSEGPAVGGGLLASGAAAGAGMAALPAMAAVGVVAGGAEAYRQIFGQDPLLGQKGLTQEEAAKLITVKALEQSLGEGIGRLAGGAVRLIKGASLKQLQGMTNLPTQYVERALERPSFALPKSGETLASAEASAMKHLGDVQTHLESERSEAGQGVDRALEALHVKTGGKKIADTQPLADAMRKAVDEKYRSGDPTVQALAKDDMKKIYKVLRTMDTKITYADPAEGRALRKAAGIIEPGKESFKQVTRPMKSIKDLVQIRRELDNLVGYTPAGVPKMSSDMGTQFAKALADEFRGLIASTAESNGDKNLLLANSRFSNVAKNYDEWQPIFTSKTDGIGAKMSRVRALDKYVSEGGAQAQSLETLKEAFPKSGRSVDALHDALTRRALIKAEDVNSTNFIKNVLKEASGKRASPTAAIRSVSEGAGSSVPKNVQRGSSLSAGVINALLSNIKPRDEK